MSLTDVESNKTGVEIATANLGPGAKTVGGRRVGAPKTGHIKTDDAGTIQSSIVDAIAPGSTLNIEEDELVVVDDKDRIKHVQEAAKQLQHHHQMPKQAPKNHAKPQQNANVIQPRGQNH